MHNRIGSAQQPGEWLYNPDNQLLEFGSGTEQTTYTYTDNGHMATQTKNGQLLTYTYDATDRLVSVHNGTIASGREIARYAYDPMGRRISKTVNGETTFYLYTDEGLLAELDDAGNILVAYGWQADAMFGTAPLWQAQVSSGNLQTAQYHFLYTDHLGTPQLAVNSNGQVTWQARSEAFGKTILNPANEITMNLRFPGQYFDAETNTHYNYFRDYNPSVGRYIERDPIGLNGGINLYSFVMGNPLKWLDSIGLDPGDIFPDINDAVFDSGQYARNHDNQSIEYGGWIYQKDGGYSYNFGIGGPTSVPIEVVDELYEKCNGTAIALWHTHPDPDPNYNGKNNDFSGSRNDVRVRAGPNNYGKFGDIGVGQWFKKDVYVVNPRNEVLRYDVRRDTITNIGSIPF